MAKKPEQKNPQDYVPKPPKQVQDQVAAANAHYESQQPAEPQPVEGASPGEPALVAEAGTPPPQSTPQAAAGEEDGDQRYRSLQGRYDTLQKNYAQQGNRIDELERLIATMKIRGAEEQSRPDAAVPQVKQKFVTEKEAEEYGQDFLDVVGKRAKEEYFAEFDQLANRLKRLEGRVDGVGTVMAKNETDGVYSALTATVPEWRNINRSDDFKSWLSEVDPYSGRQRNDMLQEAFSRHEGARVVSFFRGFLEAAGTPQASPSPGNSAPPLPGQNGQASGKPSLEEFAAPGRARTAPQSLPPEKPIYTSAWIAKFTADRIAGKYRGREADADAIERDIFQAQHEGRIQ